VLSYNASLHSTGTVFCLQVIHCQPITYCRRLSAHTTCKQRPNPQRAQGTLDQPRCSCKRNPRPTTGGMLWHSGLSLSAATSEATRISHIPSLQASVAADSTSCCCLYLSSRSYRATLSQGALGATSKLRLAERR